MEKRNSADCSHQKHGDKASPVPSKTSENNLYEDGHIILAKKGSTEYVTGFKVNRKHQRRDVWQDVLLETLLPACNAQQSPSCGRRVWNFVSCEPFLLCLHLSAVLLGVLKVTIHNREVDEWLHVAESIVETLVAIAQIVIRMVVASQRFHDIKTHQQKVEVEKGHTRGRGIHRLLVSFHVIGGLLVVFCIACAVAFYFQEHMEWTILSNNFALVVGTVTSNLLLDRINHTIYIIREDQHKAVIYESLMLLTQSARATEPKDRQKLQERIENFCTALQDTPLFDKPSYMDCSDEYKPHWNMLTSMQMQTNL